MRVDVCLAAALAATLLPGCGGHDPSSNTGQARAEPAASRVVLEPAKLPARESPLGAFTVHLDGFQFANGQPEVQDEAHHFCAVIDADLQQCVLFDGGGAGAKLVGIEYVVSRRVFDQLPMAERALWHSHAYEVSSGLLVAPGLPEHSEHELMGRFAGTYGKTWRTWHTQRDAALPAGIPVLMAGFTDDGQVNADLVADRDARLDIETSDRQTARVDIDVPDVIDGADAWQQGAAMQLTLHPVAISSPARREAEPDRDEGVDTPTPRSRDSRRRDVYAELRPAPGM